MALRFQCPNCQAVRAANPRLLGREIKCPECGGAVVLPSADEVAEARAAQQQQQAEELALQQALSRIRTQNFNWVPDAEEEEEVDEEQELRQMAAEERALAAATANFKRPRPQMGKDMDMTPMVDVTFLLLIFFMITASFSVQKSIQRPAQKEQDASAQVVQPTEEDISNVVTVQVDEFNAYSVITADWDRVAGSKQDLIVALNVAHEGNASGSTPTKLVIQAHENCIHAAVISALDAGREAQFENFEVSTVEQFD
ncbi:MAG: biopolymer transporter ExbD [Pirellulaceae bacterium]